MYKVSLANLHDAYLKGYVDAIGEKPNLRDGLEVYKWLTGDESKTTLVDGQVTDAALKEWQTEIINKEIEDFYLDDTEEILVAASNPFGEHFSINPNSAKEI